MKNIKTNPYTYGYYIGLNKFSKKNIYFTIQDRLDFVIGYYDGYYNYCYYDRRKR